MKGVVFHTSTATTLHIAVLASAVQAIFSAIRPQSSRIWFTTPNWSCSIQAHILADTMVGMAQGTSTAVRTRVRPLNSWFSSRATPRPARVSRITETKANWKVLRMAVPQSLAQKPSA